MGCGSPLLERSEASIELWRASSNRADFSWPAYEFPIICREKSAGCTVTLILSGERRLASLKRNTFVGAVPPMHARNPLWLLLLERAFVNIFATSCF